MAHALTPDSLASNVIKSIQEMIQRGELLPGDALPSHEKLAVQFGVGLSTIREAMRALAIIGAVEVRPGRGTRVMPDAMGVLSDASAVKATLRDITPAELLEGREVLELTLTRLAACRANADDLAEMAQALAAMRDHIEDDEIYSRADIRFHMAVARAAKNQLLLHLYSLTRSFLEECIHHVVHLPGVKEQGMHLQEQMLYAIAQHQPEAAQLAAEQHMAAFAASLQAKITAGGVLASGE